jgi:hypothetical protein
MVDLPSWLAAEEQSKSGVTTNIEYSSTSHPVSTPGTTTFTASSNDQRWRLSTLDLFKRISSIGL